MALEEQYAIALGVLSIVLWGGGWIIARRLAAGPPRMFRTMVPIIAVVTLACFALFVAIARAAVKG